MRQSFPSIFAWRIGRLRFREVKRFFDLFSVLLAVALLWPLLLVLMAFVWLCHGWPVFFCQQRPGMHGRPFLMFKFRTMNQNRDAQGNLLPDAQRLTSFRTLSPQHQSG